MKLNFKSFGSGDPLLILHGLFGSLDNWSTLGRRFGETYTSFLIDQRDHGKSPHTEQFDYPTLVEDLKAFMENQWIYNAVLLGHSMGGKTVMNMALSYPEMVKKLIVVDMAPRQYANRHQHVFEAIRAVPVDTLEHRLDAKAILMEHLNGDIATTAFLQKNLRRKKTGGFEWKMNVNLLEKNYSKIVEPLPEGSYEGRTLFIKGENSQYIVEADEQLIYQQFPNAQIITIEDAGHWLHAEKPDELYQIVREFIDN